MPRDKRSSRVPIGRKSQVLRRAKHKCVFCGGKATTVDHKVPVAWGGTDDIENLAAACKDCNQARGSAIDFNLFLRFSRRFGKISRHQLINTNKLRLRGLYRMWQNGMLPVRFVHVNKQRYPDYKQLITRFVAHQRSLQN